ncbi:unnamed protein product, partial [Prorocentrum cordatum]
SIPPLSPPPDACLPPPPREALEETEGDGAEPVRGPEDDFLLLLTHAEQQAQISQVQELAPEERREEGAALREGHCDAGPEVQGGAVDVSGVPDGVLSGFACCRCLTLLQVPDTGRLGKIETKVFCSFLFLGQLGQRSPAAFWLDVWFTLAFFVLARCGSEMLLAMVSGHIP